MKDVDGGSDTAEVDRDFREGAVQIVRGTVKPIAQVVRDLGVNERTLANWVAPDGPDRAGDGR